MGQPYDFRRIRDRPDDHHHGPCHRRHDCQLAWPLAEPSPYYLGLAFAAGRALVFLTIVATWGVYFRDFASEPPNPPLWRFSVILVQAIAIYLAARASLPDEVPSEGCRLADHYEQVSSYLWASLSFTYLIYIGSKLSRLGWSAIVDPYLPATLQLLVMIVLVVVRRRRIHALLTPVVVALLCYEHLTEPMFG